jgi:protein phosphatase
MAAITTHAVTNIGHKRSRNEDRYLVREMGADSILLAVADGMGGEAKGDVAAQTVIDALTELASTGDVSESILQEAVSTANDALLRMVAREPELEGMGTTATIVLVKGMMAHFIHVGDSRLYLFRDGTLTQKTSDHAFLQTFLDDGSMTPEEVGKHPFRNLLDQCVGCPECSPDSERFTVVPGDILLLTSDGLHKDLDDRQIVQHLATDTPLDRRLETLVESALALGGKDNITAVAAEFTAASS